MHNSMRSQVVERAAQLPADVEKIPDRKSFFARQHGGDAVALHILHGGTELAFDHAGAEDGRNVGAAQCFRALRLSQQRLFERRRALTERAQLNYFQGNRLRGLRVIGFVDRARWRFRQLTQNLEGADLRRHVFRFQKIPCDSAAIAAKTPGGHRPRECVP